ncbi:MAG: 2-oxoacid:acceptor oxidoreductase family protein [Anaerolineales bacterium]|nr:2-oxoacid:acceptor oxidoreductase family protein [Anaerolineales bacterium]
MQTEIVIAGFGGQGALFAGQLLAYAALEDGRHVTWIPSYGPEMRGGTAHCTVIISDDEIGSPLVRNPAAVIAMNTPSVEKFAPAVAAGGLLVINALTPDQDLPLAAGVRVLRIPANSEAEALGYPRAANLVLLGALLAALPDSLALEAVERALETHLPAHRRDSLEQNRQALRRGAALAGLVPAQV